MFFKILSMAYCVVAVMSYLHSVMGKMFLYDLNVCMVTFN